MFSASSVIKAFETYSQELMKSVKNSVFHAIDDLGFCRLDPIKWSYVENISFEMVVMFPKRNIAVAILHGGFLNPYDWNAVWEDQKMGKNMIAKSENVTEIGCKNVLLRSENDTQHLVGLGLDNIFAVAMPDAVLVVKKDCAKDVKKVIKFLNKNKLHQAENFPKDHRPWVYFESLIIQNRFQVKRMIV
jgi:mannose-1-phosphate guanylyltransferase